ncbi:MAG: HAD hydrolase family protein [Pseudomonadota bacterium]
MMSLGDVLVVSDLDGTLLDHETYAWTAAAPALDILRRDGATLILASSKTAAEIAPIRAEIGFDHCPAIVENGSGLLEPGEAPIADTATYNELRKAIDTLPAGFRGFGDMSAAEISDRTGLSIKAAGLARERQFSEPGLWTGDALDAFLEATRAAGLTAQRGGRFITLSFGGTKADKVSDMITRFKPRHTIVLGDAPNDVDMLALADSGVIVANPASPDLPTLPGEDTGRIRRTVQAGPEGWAAAVLDIIQEISTRKDACTHG